MALIEEIQDFLNTRLITISDQDITVGQVVSIPLFIAVGFLLIRWIIRLADRLMQARGVSPDLIQIMRRAMMVLGLIILFITTLDLLEVPLTAFAFVSGAIAIGVGFGAQNIINNFISGWILMWERPIRINDFIELDDMTGTVETINTRSTRVRRVDGVHLLVPNSQLLERTVVNWTLVDRNVRSVVRVGVAYGSDTALTYQILSDVVEANADILEEPAPNVIFDDFGDSALIFDIYFWVIAGGEKGARQIRSDIRFEIDRRFREAGIVIAFPQRDVHVNGELILKQPDSADAAS